MTYSFTTLAADLMSGNSAKVVSVQINNEGQVLGSVIGFFGADYAVIDNFIYDNGVHTTLTGLPDTGNFSTFAVAINDSGQVAGNYDNGTTPQGFLYSNGISTTLTDPSAIGPTFPDGPGGNVNLNGTSVGSTSGFYTHQFGGVINDNGEVVGTYGDGTGDHGFIYSNGTYTTLDAPSATNGFGVFDFPLGTSAVAINIGGQVVGNYTTDVTNTISINTVHGFLYSNGTYLTLSDPLATGDGSTVVAAINNLGQVIGNSDGSGGRGFLYNNGNYITIDDPSLSDEGPGQLVGINNVGQVIGNSLNANFVEQGFVFSGGTYTQISDPLGTEGTFLQSINDLGQITGYYVDSSGSQHAFVADPSAPQPTTIEQEIAGLYAAVYNRTADASGVQYWVNVVAEQADALGVTVASAANTPISTNDASLLGQLFVSTQSAYFNLTYGNLNDADFVNALYFNMGGQNAETSSAITYWVNIIQAGEASGLSIQNARASMVGQFVHDLIDVDLTQWTSILTPSELETAILRQAVVDNKLAVSLAYVDASANPNGSLLNADVVGDAAFQAEINALNGVAIDPSTATVQIASINQAVSDQNLADIHPLGIFDLTNGGYTAANPFNVANVTGYPITGVQFSAADSTVGGEYVVNLPTAATVTVSATFVVSGLTLTHTQATGDNLAVTFLYTPISSAMVSNTLEFLTSTGDTTVGFISNGPNVNVSTLSHDLPALIETGNTLGQLIETDNTTTTVTIAGSHFFSLGHEAQSIVGGGTLYANANAEGVVTDAGATANIATTVASSLTLIDASANTGGVFINAGATNTSSGGTFLNGASVNSNITITYTGLTIKGGSGTDFIENNANNGIVIDGNGTGDFDHLGGSGATAILGNGSGDSVVLGGSGETAILGNGANDGASVGEDTGVALGDTVTFAAANSATLVLGQGAAVGLTAGTTNIGQTTVIGAQPGMTIVPDTLFNSPLVVNEQAAVASATSLSQAENAAAHALGAKGVAYFTMGANTYVIDVSATEAAVSANDYVVELVGVPVTGIHIVLGTLFAS